MNTLIEKTDQKAYDLLHLLTTNYGHGLYTLDFDFLSDQLRIERRTLAKILQSIASDIEELALTKSVHFVIKPSSLTFEIKPDTTIEPFQSLYLNRSIMGRFLDDVFFQKFTTVEEFLYDTYISKTTFFRRLALLRILLKSYNLTLDLTSKNIIIGEEHMIRYFFYIFYSKRDTLSYSFQSPYLSMDTESELFTLFPTFKNFSVPLYLKLRVYLIIMIERIKQGHPLTITVNILTLENYMWDEAILREIFERILLKVGVPKNQLMIETTFVLYIIAALNTLSLDKFDTTDSKKIQFYNSRNNNTHLWIDLFCKTFNLTLKSNEYMFLLTNLTYIHERKRLFGNAMANNERAAPPKDSYETTHHYVIERSKVFYETLEQHDFTFDDELIYSYFILIRALTNQIKPPLQIFLLCKMDDNQYSFLKNTIQQTVHYAEFVDDPTQPVDLIIADFPIESLPFWSSETTIFHWNSFPTKSQWLSLLEKLEQMYYG